MTKQITCRDCGMVFEFTENQQKDYEQKGYRAPIRCKTCRKEMREKRQDPYWGIEEVMFNYVPTKRRRHRVHYCPHTVLGFR